MGSFLQSKKWVGATLGALLLGLALMSSPVTRLLAHTFPSVQKGLDRALIVAVKADNERQVNWLLSRGANVNAEAQDGTTALHLAAAASPERSERLLNAFAGRPLHWNQTNQVGITPFAVLVSARLGANLNPFVERCQLALEEGADANVGNAGYPLLTLAAEQMNPRFVRLLLEHGARVNDVNPYGETALNVLLDSCAQDCGQLGFSKSSDCLAAKNQGRELVAVLLKAGANPLAPDYFQVTPLQHAREHAATQSLVPLLQRYASKFRN